MRVEATSGSAPGAMPFVIPKQKGGFRQAPMH
jgi:hypothetical protein